MAGAVYIPEFIIILVQKPKLAVLTLVAVAFLVVFIIGTYLMGGPYNSYDFSDRYAEAVGIYRKDTLPRINATNYVSVRGYQLSKQDSQISFANTGRVEVGKVSSTHFMGYLDGTKIFSDSTGYSTVDTVVTGLPIQMITYGVNCSFMVNFTQKVITDGGVRYATDLCFTVTWGSHVQYNSTTGTSETVTCYQWFSQSDGCRYPAGQQLLTSSTPLNTRYMRVYIRTTDDPVVSLAAITRGTSALTDGVDRRGPGMIMCIVGITGMLGCVVWFLRDEDRYKIYLKAIRENCKNFRRNVKRRFCDKCCPDDEEEIDADEAHEIQLKEQEAKQAKAGQKKHLDYDEFRKQQQEQAQKGRAIGGTNNNLNDQLLHEQTLMPAAAPAVVVRSENSKKNDLDSAKDVSGGNAAGAKDRRENRPKFDEQPNESSASNNNSRRAKSYSTVTNGKKGGGSDAAVVYPSANDYYSSSAPAAKQDPAALQNALDML